MLNLKDITATLALLTSGGLMLTGCDKTKEATEVPGGGGAEEGKAEGSCGGEKKAEGSCSAEKKAEGSCSAEKKAEGSCGGAV